MVVIPRNTFVLLALDRQHEGGSGSVRLRYLQWLRKGQRLACTLTLKPWDRDEHGTLLRYGCPWPLVGSPNYEVHVRRHHRPYYRTHRLAK